ncbi:early nodulin-like protein 1 [Tripterygium wilfordii]|uniref:Early nodulin-like protein 1 n=1 Tax=Tripterygium wilfordii TaxID=458696 RepID=A0A7J7D6V0_TRIWF|nr:early nodulin-like protein 1 [Tripterygium wilfordii]
MASVRVVTFLFVPLLFLLFTSSECREILVGGKHDSWRLPSSHDNDSLNQWARRTRFKVGDVLVFQYDSKIDSVLEVTKRDYQLCNPSNPILEYKENLTKIELDHSGPFYFISGSVKRCKKAQRMVVDVLSQDHWAALAPAPVPISGPGLAPAPAPHAGANELESGVLALLVGLGTLVGLVLI